MNGSFSEAPQPPIFDLVAPRSVLTVAVHGKELELPKVIVLRKAEVEATAIKSYMLPCGKGLF